MNLLGKKFFQSIFSVFFILLSSFSIGIAAEPHFETNVYAMENNTTNGSETAQIGNYVWVDMNQNGLQDEGEEPVFGAVVELYDTEGNPTTDINDNHSVTTDVNGSYLFDVLPGGYQVKFIIPDAGYDGYVFSNPDQGENDGMDTDADDRGLTEVIEVEEGESRLTLDAGINSGWNSVSYDSAASMTIYSILAMIFMTLYTVLFFMRKEDQLR